MGSPSDDQHNESDDESSPRWTDLGRHDNTTMMMVGESPRAWHTETNFTSPSLSPRPPTTKTTTTISAPKTKTMMTWTALCKHRIIHSIVILFVILYFILSLRTMQAVYCISVPTEDAQQLRLNVERAITCYTLSHLYAAPFAWVMVVLFIVGFPMFCLGMIVRARVKGVSPAFQLRFGFLTRSLRPRRHVYSIAPILINLAVAIQTVIGIPTDESLLVNGLIFCVNIIVLSLFWPFLKRVMNIFVLTGAYARLVYVLVLSGRQGGMYFTILIVVSAVTVVITCVAVALRIRRAKAKVVMTRQGQDVTSIELK
eukprot:TRINITY_DN25647_c0_g1_i1.p1 TRINITY_DN25647_c0_g1~~TRINITY_DN25647_c0_g1_i1.p1  ORF type:complete len:358 (+),score=61.47 TRINITY_DN25647_c0_g1_i1:137-1075(+)